MANANYIPTSFDSDALLNVLGRVTYAQMQAQLARRRGCFTDTELFYFRTIHKALHIADVDSAANFADAWFDCEAIHQVPHLTERSHALYQLADCSIESMVSTFAAEARGV